MRSSEQRHIGDPVLGRSHVILPIHLRMANSRSHVILPILRMADSRSHVILPIHLRMADSRLHVILNLSDKDR